MIEKGQTQEAIYTVYDGKMLAYMAPFTAPNNAVATRHFSGSLLQDGLIRRNPEDFTLWRVGTWCPQNALVQEENPVCIAKAHELLAAMQADENEKQLHLLQGA